ncbi:MAG: hypothetical protein U9R53_08245 [Chloroflexota bacterium]|nr:hypothetical protein [Chloroflexota bacterium]
MTNTASPTLTETFTPTITLTTTLANTITPRPSSTSTITPTSYRTLTPTATPSQVPAQPAVLFPYKDTNGRMVDWSYIYVTRLGSNQFNVIDDLWAFISFQLLDRAIHQRNFNFLGETITVYFLNVAHDFNGELLPMQLVLGGTLGADVPIEDIPAGGSSYLQVGIRTSSDSFDPYLIHRYANSDYETRESAYPLLYLEEFKELLPTLPDEIILLAEHPILFPHNDWPQIKLDMQRVNYLAARYQPFFEFDVYDRLVDQSDFAYALRDHIFRQDLIPLGIYGFSSQTLIIIQGDE